jgi:uncharacterized protein (TIGR02217 family)
MAFLETRFFTDIRPEANGGPVYRTTVKQLRGGGERRNAMWADPLRSFNVSLGARDTDDIHDLLDFVADTEGAAHGFRLKDWSDFKSCPPRQTVTALDVPVGTGNGTTYWWRLNKPYGASYQRRITKPVIGSLVVAVDGVAVGPTVWFGDYVNGTIVFKNPPLGGAVITAGFEFDVPVRFTDDATDISMLAHKLAGSANIAIQEVRVIEDIDIAVYDALRASL